MVLVWNRTTANAERLVASLGKQDATFCVVADLAEAAATADIISTATMAKEPFLKGEWLQPGCHVDLIGAYTPDMREADDQVLTRGEIFVDSQQDHHRPYRRDPDPARPGTISESDIRGAFGDLVAGTAGRSSPDAITVFKNGGGAHLDLMVADLIARVVENR